MYLVCQQVDRLLGNDVGRRKWNAGAIWFERLEDGLVVLDLVESSGSAFLGWFGLDRRDCAGLIRPCYTLMTAWLAP